MVLQQGKSKANMPTPSQAPDAQRRSRQGFDFPCRIAHAGRRRRQQVRCQLACWHSLVRAKFPGHPHWYRGPLHERRHCRIVQDLLYVDARQHQPGNQRSERKHGVDGIECIPRKRVVEADYLNFTVKKEMQSWQQVCRFSLCGAQAGVRRP